VRKQLRLLFRQFAQPKEGYEIHALLGDRGEPGFAQDVEQARKLGVQVTLVPAFRREVQMGKDRETYRFLKERLAALTPYLVHTHSAKAGFLGRLAAHACGVPRIIHTPHVFPFQWATGLKGRFYLELERYAARRCHALVCVGKGQREDALQRRVAPPGKLVLIRNGIALPDPVTPGQRTSLRVALGLPPDVPTVGMVARLAPQKGVFTFLEAAARVLRRTPEVLFVLIGDGPLRADVHARAAQLGLGPAKLKLPGHLEDAEKCYPAFDVLALTSYYEGLPYVLLEGMAYGVPVVATDVLGSREVVIDGNSGLLTRPGDPADLAEKIFSIICSAELRRTLSAGARARVQKTFPLDPFLEAHRKLYKGEGL
jgi:glycosyltransferase involved in cell wall biosynthesis